MLNATQKNLLETTITWLIDAIVDTATPEIAKSAFAVIPDTSEDYAKPREEFVSADIINEVDELRAYYHHPNVQNRPKEDPQAYYH
jgi:hypothetical protein